MYDQGKFKIIHADPIALVSDEVLITGNEGLIHTPEGIGIGKRILFTDDFEQCFTYIFKEYDFATMTWTVQWPD